MNFIVGALFVFTVFIGIYNYEMMDKGGDK